MYKKLIINVKKRTAIPAVRRTYENRNLSSILRRYVSTKMNGVCAQIFFQTGFATLGS